MRHDLLHKALCFVVGCVGIDQYFTDILTQVVANGPNNNVAFLHQQGWGAGIIKGTLDGIPEFDQVIQIPLQFFGAAANTCGTDDDAHFVGYFDALHGFA